MKLKLLPVALLTILFTGCASLPTASEISATAQKFATDAVGYAQTLGTMLQTVNTTVQADAPALEALAESWGLMPANSKQLAIYNTVVADTAKVTGDVVAVNKLLSPASLTSIATAPTTTTLFKPKYIPVAKDNMDTPGAFAQDFAGE